MMILFLDDWYFISSFQAKASRIDRRHQTRFSFVRIDRVTIWVWRPEVLS
jgi:hypothetical protein